MAINPIDAMSISMIILFTSFNGFQSLATSILPASFSETALTALYASFALAAALGTGPLLASATPKTIASVSFAGYAAMTGISAVVSRWGSHLGTGGTAAAAVTVGVWAGLSAAALWTAQGVYCARWAAVWVRADERAVGDSSDAASLDDRISARVATVMSRFWGLFQLNIITANLLSILVLSAGVTAKHAILWVFTGVAFLAIVFIVVVVPPLPAEARLPPAPSHAGPRRSAAARAWAALATIATQYRDPRLLRLIAVFAYSGAEQGFLYSNFTAGVIAPGHGPRGVAICMVAFGVLDVVTAAATGRIFNRLGRRVGFVIGAVPQAAFLGYYGWREVRGMPPTELSLPFLAASVALYGVGDAIMNTLPPTLIGDAFPTPGAAQDLAFANFKFVQSLVFALAFALATATSLRTKFVAMIVLLALAVTQTMLCAPREPAHEGQSARAGKRRDVESERLLA